MSKKQIVIIDDEEINIEILQVILKDDANDAYEFNSFTNAAEGLEHCLNNLPDIILLDLYMPNLDGLSFIKKYFSAKNKFERASVIVISVSKTPEIIQKCLELGVNDFISKPYEAINIISRVKNCLESKELLQAIHESYKEKQSLLRVLIHDITTPLTILDYHVRRISDDHLYEFVKKMKVALKTVNEIIVSVQNIEEIETTKSSLDIEPTPLNPIIADLEIIFENKLKEKNITLEVIRNSEEIVLANANVLKQQVIANLISNAIKFTNKDGKISIEIAPAGTKQVDIIITDTGIGIPENMQSKLFSWTEKTSRLGTDGEKGTGFGMPIVKRFIDQFGGVITIESPVFGQDKDGHGTQIKITLNKAEKFIE